MNWPLALLLTLAVEVPFVVACAARYGFAPAGRAAWVAACLNTVSHTLLWFVLAPGLGVLAGYWTATVLAEAAVVGLETCGYAVLCRMRIGPASALAVSANVLSVAVALVRYTLA